jgi:superfamily II DNA or RNA helicase
MNATATLENVKMENDSSVDELDLKVILKADLVDRWYQMETRDQAFAYLDQGFSRILVELPTGAGKTYTAKLIVTCPNIRKVLGVDESRPLRLLYLAHMHRLLDQAEEYYDADCNVEFIRHSIFQPLSQEVLDKGWDLCILDEAHHEPMRSMQYHLDKINDKPIIGMTATPDRGDGLLLKFQKRVNTITRKEAVEQGYLADTVLNTIIDTSGTDKTGILSDLIINFGSEMGKTILFTRTKKEAIALADVALMIGKNAVCLTDQTQLDVSAILEKFSKGHIDFITNCSKINEGVDVVGCDNIILGKQYKSPNEINQAIGRAARPDSDCNVWQLSNPIRKQLDSRAVIGEPKEHRIIQMHEDGAETNFY